MNVLLNSEISKKYEILDIHILRNPSIHKILCSTKELRKTKSFPKLLLAIYTSLIYFNVHIYISYLILMIQFLPKSQL